MFSLMRTTLIALIIGAVAKLIMPGKNPAGLDRHRSSRSGRLIRRRLSWAPGWPVQRRAIRRLHRVRLGAILLLYLDRLFIAKKLT